MNFQPKEYKNIAELKQAAIWAANSTSNSTIRDTPIFGFIGVDFYKAVLSYCEFSEDYYWVAGDKIPQHYFLSCRK
jgi:hypothetical protein